MKSISMQANRPNYCLVKRFYKDTCLNFPAFMRLTKIKLECSDTIREVNYRIGGPNLNDNRNSQDNRKSERPGSFFFILDKKCLIIVTSALTIPSSPMRAFSQVKLKGGLLWPKKRKQKRNSQRVYGRRVISIC